MSYLDPMDERELEDVMAVYGKAEVEEIEVGIDRDLFQNRFLKSSDRRGEVVFAIQMPEGILVHHKAFYGDGVFRLLSGGIDYGEKVVDALRREIEEETSLTLSSGRLLGVQDCQLVYGSRSVRFVSYVFYVRAAGDLYPDPKENITEFRTVSLTGLAAIAEDLRRAPAPQEGWGRWRALAHDLVYQRLMGQVHNGD